MELHTPVVFLVFNRPDLTKIVFEAIRKAKPYKLLVVADGPRAGVAGEAEKCQAVRDIIDTVDWDCEVIKNYADTNLGCRARVSSGITWAFDQVEEAIILEDDCLPDPSFFPFCEQLLKHYRHDERVMVISGNNFQENCQTKSSYYFSKYPHIWGWATWRRAWKHYDVDMKDWQRNKLEIIHATCGDPYEKKYWLDKFERTYSGSINTWDYQWTYACWSQGGLSIVPSVNLVSNIGFRSDATHTVSENQFANLPVSRIWEIQHPELIIRNIFADEYLFNNYFGGNYLRYLDRPQVKIKRKLRYYLSQIVYKLKFG